MSNRGNLPPRLRVEFVGPLYGNAKWQAYSEAELFVLPTYSENFGVAVAEALACGTPAIVSQAAPWQGLQAQACGYWVKPGLESLKLILLQTLSMSQKELEEMGQRGRQWMIREFSFNRIGLMMLRTYQNMLNSHSKPAWIKL